VNGQKLKGMLGLAIRAGQTAAGAEACRILIRTGKCGVLLLDGDTGLNTRKRAAAICGQTETPMAILPEGTILEATGRNNMVLGIHKGSIAEQIIAVIHSES
jgi:ribosomal protein L7Ae-like RNA K-turn-binding protein